MKDKNYFRTTSLQSRQVQKKRRQGGGCEIAESAKLLNFSDIIGGKVFGEF